MSKYDNSFRGISQLIDSSTSDYKFDKDSRGYYTTAGVEKKAATTNPYPELLWYYYPELIPVRKGNFVRVYCPNSRVAHPIYLYDDNDVLITSLPVNTEHYIQNRWYEVVIPQNGRVGVSLCIMNESDFDSTFIRLYRTDITPICEEKIEDVVTGSDVFANKVESAINYSEGGGKSVVDSGTKRYTFPEENRGYYTAVANKPQVRNPYPEQKWYYLPLIHAYPGDRLRVYSKYMVNTYYAYFFDIYQRYLYNNAWDVSNMSYNDGSYMEVIVTEECLVGVSFAIRLDNLIEDVYLEHRYGYFTDIAKTCIGRVATDHLSQLSYYNKGAALKSSEKAIAIISAGQSNIDGRVPNAEMPPEIKSSMPMANCHYAAGGTTAQFQPLNLTGQWAFDLIPYYNISSVLNKELYVMKYSLGATSIDIEGTNSHWTADYEPVIKAGQTSLLRIFEDLVKNRMRMDGDKFDIRAFLWHQGEGDCAEGPAARYYSNLKNLIAYVRGMVGNACLPFITGTVSHKSEQFSQEVEDAQKRLADEDPNFYLIDMSGAPLLDQYHFDAQSTIYFGKMAFNALVDAGVLTASKLEATRPW